MHMAWHDDPCIDAHMGEMLGDCLPTGRGNFPQFIELHVAVYHPTKQAPMSMQIDGGKIHPRPAIIKPTLAIKAIDIHGNLLSLSQACTITITSALPITHSTYAPPKIARAEACLASLRSFALALLAPLRSSAPAPRQRSRVRRHASPRYDPCACAARPAMILALAPLAPPRFLRLRSAKL